MMRARVVLASFVTFMLLLVLAAPASADHPSQRATAGRIDLPTIGHEPLLLQGEWGFAWQQFIDPGWEQLPTSAVAAVPSSWNDVTAGGKPPGPSGWGSYALLLNCPAGKSLAVEAVQQRTASRLFVNGTAVAAHGEPGTDAGASLAAVHNRVPISQEFSCPLRITLHVSNFDHRAGGFVRPLLVGPVDALARHRESAVARHAGLLAAYLLTGFVALLFFAMGRRERIALVFGLFCLAMAVYTDMIGQRLFLRAFSGQVSWLAYMRVEYLSWILAMALFLVIVRSLFPGELQRRLAPLMLAGLAASAVCVVVLPPAIYSHGAAPGQFLAVLATAAMAFSILRSGRRDRGDARVLLAGMLAVLAAMALDLLLIDSVHPDQKFAPLGFALFLLSPAVVIARRMSEALNAEERSRTLEENARLREDVERISRHDLKTPLNSILGVARLLREDKRLLPGQRELVDVLQHAGLRMLEMVNLSLGLFKMETGSYEFRPQAVDLREVVGRVLLDLQSHAKSHGVALQVTGSDRAPVWVWAEELLCYSIVANLVKNAVEASGPGERVTLSLVGGDPVRLVVHNPGDVPPDIAARFFEKYVTGGKRGGTGLGTYSARLMARAQRGDLSLRSGPLAGTTVTLSLRALAGAAPGPSAGAVHEDEPPPLWAPDLPERRVLVVDDDEFSRFVTAQLLPSPPFRAETAADGQAAIEAMLAHWPDYVLLDMEMPTMDGLETVQRIRHIESEQDRPPCHVLMLSGHDDAASAARAIEAGADRFLGKPVNRDWLLAALWELEQAPREKEGPWISTT